MIVTTLLVLAKGAAIVISSILAGFGLSIGFSHGRKLMTWWENRKLLQNPIYAELM